MSNNPEENRRRARQILSDMTEEENAAIQAGIEADPDSPELTAEDFARMRPFHDVYPEFAAAPVQSRQIPSRDDAATERVDLRLSREVLDHFRAGGQDWQKRIDEALRKAAGL